jgi:hypothetical protein
MAWIKKEILLPKDYDDDDANTVAEELLSFIVERSKKGQGSDGELFPAYSDSYKKSNAFKLGDKSSKINLTLSGEMLDSLQVLSARKGKIVIGFEKDDERNNSVAEGNILGSYGGEANKSRARNFMELSDKELAKVIRSLDILPRDIQNEIAKQARAGAIEIVDKFQFDLEE